MSEILLKVALNTIKQTNLLQFTTFCLIAIFKPFLFFLAYVQLDALNVLLYFFTFLFLVFLLQKKGCIRIAAASDKVYQLLAHGRWFSPGTLASSTTKTGRHDIAEILLKVALKHQK
jgi:hypothetical protein